MNKQTIYYSSEANHINDGSSFYPKDASLWLNMDQVGPYE